jgi:hypothetical protein
VSYEGSVAGPGIDQTFVRQRRDGPADRDRAHPVLRHQIAHREEPVAGRQPADVGAQQLNHAGDTVTLSHGKQE